MSGLNQQIANLSYVVKAYRGFESPSFRHIMRKEMTEFTVHYELDGHVYHSKIWTDKSGSALIWVKKLFPDAINVYVVG